LRVEHTRVDYAYRTGFRVLGEQRLAVTADEHS
jgi:hypothetical protein